MLKIAAKVQFEMGAGGDLYMDIRNRSNCSNFNNVVELASDRKIWKNLVEVKFDKSDRARRIVNHKLQTKVPAFTLSPRAPAFVPRRKQPHRSCKGPDPNPKTKPCYARTVNPAPPNHPVAVAEATCSARPRTLGRAQPALGVRL